MCVVVSGGSGVQSTAQEAALSRAGHHPVSPTKPVAIAEPSVKLDVFNTTMPVPDEGPEIHSQDDRRYIQDKVLRGIDNLLEGWAYPAIRDRVTVVYCHKPTLDVSWICHDDIAAMQRPEPAGRNFPVGGPETVRLLTIDDFCDKIQVVMKERSNIDAKPLIEQMHKAYTFYNESPDEPFKVDMGPVLKELPCQLATIEEWDRRHPLPAVN
ncbi:hypothetical protein F5Y16DRAFT_413786 [Xylariaceae sp. FL0255]|nr:hypothetical protein F5Y16DRAFT_413786 [Xylariaceae sp. FL0255]